MKDIKKKKRWFFSIETIEDSLDAIKIAYQAAFFVAVLMAIIFLPLMWLEGNWNANIFDPIFYTVLGWIIKSRQSRTAAVLFLMYAIIVTFLTLAAKVGAPMTNFGGKNIVLAIIVLYASYKGVQGTFGYHRIKRTVVNFNHLIWLSIIIFVYSLLYIGLMIFFMSDPEVWAKVEIMPDDILGLLFFGPVLLIMLFGAIGILPGTKKLKIVSVPMMSSEIKESSLSKNYITQHWNGELSLAQSYWVNIFLIGIVFSIANRSIENSNLYETDLLLAIQLSIALIVISIPITIWQIGGCWRAAVHHKEVTGRSFWANITQFVLVIGVGYIIMVWSNAIPQLVELTKIATRTEDYTDYNIEILHDGSEIEINGYMAFGIDKDIINVLQKNPDYMPACIC